MKTEKTTNQGAEVEMGDIKHKGYGLAHIIDKHGDDIKALGFILTSFSIK